ncbi:uncharacterized protein EV420DRAFT_1485186 [Desarmillaria tabescens]|uniref:Uncharacterized protein n=1 Tax=Armillaria tabescens TaxID=1929756 RepID=A0AA39JHA3_ARMTA|nr:uncharacterized protein EV420DRAFT_1485186 [Desarmillaria tabescens]KAK0442765.1 hypothetical protein EV420DRAFT_1485186 [Desarmillaria tabescens]
MNLVDPAKSLNMQVVSNICKTLSYQHANDAALFLNILRKASESKKISLKICPKMDVEPGSDKENEKIRHIPGEESQSSARTIADNDGSDERGFVLTTISYLHSTTTKQQATPCRSSYPLLSATQETSTPSTSSLDEATLVLFIVATSWLGGTRKGAIVDWRYYLLGSDHGGRTLLLVPKQTQFTRGGGCVGPHCKPKMRCCNGWAVLQ